jgi:UDP-glucose-4-epimerase GalE
MLGRGRPRGEYNIRMRILVTGGAGYIGSHTVRALIERGHDPLAFDNLSYGHREAVPAERLVVGDLNDLPLLERHLAGVDAVIHFAAFAYVGESVTNPAKYYANNLINSLMLLDACRRHGVPRFVFSSTCATYGTPTSVPIAESEKQLPINPYGQTKLAFERALDDYAAAYPFGFCALRYFNAAGASPDGTIGEDHDPETHLIPLAFQAATGKRPRLDIFGTDYPTPDGTCIRDYIHVNDLAFAHILAVEKLQAGDRWKYNVGLGRGFSVREVIRTVEEVSGLTVPVKESPRRAGDPPELVADASAIRRDLGWQPRFDGLRPIIETAWNWHRTRPKGYGA